MKTQTYIRFSLLIPYLLWAICAGIVLIINSLPNEVNMDSMSVTSIISYLTFFYTFGILLWGIPYTILAISLGLWSRTKDTQKIVKVFSLSPFLFAAFLLVETLLLFLDWSNIGNGLTSQFSDVSSSVLALTGFAFVYGYLCIGIVVLLYKLLKRIALIKEQELPA